MSLWNGTPRLDGVRVLLVEGAPRVREVMAEVLGQCGAHVTAVDSAVTGLAVLKRERPDALVSSLSMPDKDGYWLIREVRKLSPDQGGDVPAAAFTGRTTAEDELATLRAGFQYHVPKPVALSRQAGRGRRAADPQEVRGVGTVGGFLKRSPAGGYTLLQ